MRIIKPYPKIIPCFLTAHVEKKKTVGRPKEKKKKKPYPKIIPCFLTAHVEKRKKKKQIKLLEGLKEKRKKKSHTPRLFQAS